MTHRPRIAVLVPGLGEAGGVPAVADFLCRMIERQGRFELDVHSVPLAAADPASVRLRSPGSWLRGPRTRPMAWRGRAATEHGQWWSEFEFQRYRARKSLTRALAGSDLVQVVAGSPAIALAAARCGRPVVLQVATRIVAERARAVPPRDPLRRAWRGAMTAICDRLDGAALAHVDAVLVENRWMRDYVAPRLRRPGAGVLLAHPGVDDRRLCPGTRDLADPYVLFVGRLGDPRKNVTLLCEAYARLAPMCARLPRLVLAGSGALPPAAQAVLAQLPPATRVEVAAAPPDEALRRLYQGASVLAVPSTEEGFGLVVTEAMACGVPVVATRCGGPEEIITDGHDGVLVPLGDAQALAMALAALLADAANAARMGERARQTIEARFGERAAFAPFLATYERLLARRTE